MYVFAFGHAKTMGKYYSEEFKQLRNNIHYSIFYFSNKRHNDKNNLIQEKVTKSKWHIIFLTFICITMVCGLVMCISFKFQKQITNPLNKMISFTKMLQTLGSNYDKHKKRRSKMTIKQIPNGVHQSAELVERFKKLLFGMNKKKEKIVFNYNKEQASDFPFNELHSSSQFTSLVDWENDIRKF
jgi:hypothetical protein